MLLALAPLVFLVLAPPALRDPPIKIKLSDDVYLRGERARVKVKTIENGYLLVVRADAQGRIRVLFPQEPGDAAAIRGGREVEIRGRGNREAFTVDDADGSGKILAAVSSRPFRTDSFARAGHWDYRALAGDDSAADPEATLLAVVDRMAAGHFDYDVVTYTVTTHPALRRSPWGRGAPSWGRGWGWGWGDPWFGCLRCRGVWR